MTRRIKQWLLPVLATVIVVMGMSASAAAYSGSLPTWGTGGTGDLKAGPLGLNESPSTGQLPVQMQIPDAEVDAEVETRTSVDGVMQDPTGPWVISWYDFTELAGANGNSVYSGHVDYWGVGPSVLRNVASLGEGAEIDVIGQDGTRFTYAVEYIERVVVADLTPEDMQNIVGDTDYAALTIITCGGEFDYDAGEYKERDIIRAKLVSTTPPDASAGEAETDEGTAEGETEGTAESEEGGEASGGELVSGGTATVTEDGVNVRSEASTSADVVTALASGETVTITGDAQEADGYTWWPIETADGSTGWIVADFLQP
jgi:sortase (surface protein transpeptidase)